MPVPHVTTEQRPAAARLRQRGGLWRVGWAVACWALLSLTGCTQIRLPAIDPTGSCIFAPSGQSTTFSPPCFFGPDGCLAGLGRLGGGTGCGCLGGGDGCLACLGGWLPEPTFPEPETPPPCLQGQPLPPGAAAPTDCVPGGAPYSRDCAEGPPAVLIGHRGHLHRHHHGKLPKRGKRGRLLLSPQRVVAPVGGEVILLSGVCGEDGRLATGEPIEWMLTPESVGHFIQIAEDDGSLLQRLSNSAEVEKVSGSFARGVTRTKPALITRGTITPNDDVRLDAGQAWATISSPTEGLSRITALAPDSDCWDQRRATATIYWVDAAFQFPGPQLARDGEPVSLTTRVTRSEGSIPAVGWKVRYTILNPELAGFAPNGLATFDAVVDEAGRATATLVPLPETAGTATVAMEVIRPATLDDNFPELPLGRGQTIVTWSAPQLALDAEAPAIAGFDEPIPVTAYVSNPGNLATGPVEVSVALPEGVQFLGSDFEHEQLGNQILWTYPEGIPSGVEGPISLELAARQPFLLRFNAVDTQNRLSAAAEVRVDVSTPSLRVQVVPTPESERLEVGEDATFEITVTNSGNRAVNGLELEVEGDRGMAEVMQGARVVYNSRQEPLLPGDSWELPVRYNVFEPGSRCLRVTASGEGQAPTTAEACVLATNPVPEVPNVEAQISGSPTLRQGALQIFNYVVRNPGRVPLRDLRVTVTFDDKVESVRATDRYRQSAESLAQYQIRWVLPELAAGAQTTIQVEYEGIGPPGPSATLLTVETAAGAQADDSFRFEVLPGQRAAPSQPTPQPPVPPTGPDPRIPPDRGPGSNPFDSGGGEAPPLQAPPLQNDGAEAPDTAPPAATNTPTTLSIFDLDDPARVGEEIRYRISVTNRADIDDTDIELRFRLSGDVQLVSVQETRFPADELSRTENGWFYLNPIPVLGPGQTVEYTLRLLPRAPQSIEVTVEAYSRALPRGRSAETSTRVLPP